MKVSDITIVKETIQWMRSKPEGTNFNYDDFINHIMLTYRGTSYLEADNIFRKILHKL
jgi:hypothetical protein